MIYEQKLCNRVQYANIERMNGAVVLLRALV